MSEKNTPKRCSGEANSQGQRSRRHPRLQGAQRLCLTVGGQPASAPGWLVTLCHAIFSTCLHPFATGLRITGRASTGPST